MKREPTLRGRKATKKARGRRWDDRRAAREQRAQDAAGRRWTHERRGRNRSKGDHPKYRDAVGALLRHGQGEGRSSQWEAGR